MPRGCGICAVASTRSPASSSPRSSMVRWRRCSLSRCPSGARPIRSRSRSSSQLMLWSGCWMVRRAANPDGRSISSSSMRTHRGRWGRCGVVDPGRRPQRVLAELAGDADVTAVVVRNGVVLHAPGELNLGRMTRLANRAQRRALRGLYSVRDPGLHRRLRPLRVASHRLVAQRRADGPREPGPDLFETSRQDPQRRLDHRAGPEPATPRSAFPMARSTAPDHPADEPPPDRRAVGPRELTRSYSLPFRSSRASSCVPTRRRTL